MKFHQYGRPEEVIRFNLLYPHTYTFKTIRIRKPVNKLPSSTSLFEWYVPIKFPQSVVPTNSTEGQVAVALPSLFYVWIANTPWYLHRPLTFGHATPWYRALRRNFEFRSGLFFFQVVFSGQCYSNVLLPFRAENRSRGGNFFSICLVGSIYVK